MKKDKKAAKPVPGETSKELSEQELDGVAGGVALSSFSMTGVSAGLEQTLNIGSQSSGAGAGKVTFNPFSITKQTDKGSTNLP
jgi:hypothetical protein